MSGPVGSLTVGFGDRERHVGKETVVAGISVFAVFQGVRVRREELKPAPDTGVLLAHLDDALESFVVRVSAEFGGPKVIAQSFYCSDDASGLEVEGRPRTFRV